MSTPIEGWPNGLFRTILVDPPWPMRWSGGGEFRTNGEGRRYPNAKALARGLPYRTMPVADIAALPVTWSAEADAHLFLWAPDQYVIDGSASLICRAWGFEPLRFIVWAKPGFGMGRFPRPQHELLLVGRRGSLPFAIANAGSVQRWKTPYARSGASAGRRHSQKPEDAQDLIERASPGPYLELFARRHRPGWTCWGDELPTFDHRYQPGDPCPVCIAIAKNGSAA